MTFDDTMPPVLAHTPAARCHRHIKMTHHCSTPLLCVTASARSDQSESETTSQQGASHGTTRRSRCNPPLIFPFILPLTTNHAGF